MYIVRKTLIEVVKGRERYQRAKDDFYQRMEDLGVQG